MSTTKMGIDARGERVLHFRQIARNVSRLGLLEDLVMKMFESGDWRTYATALGRETWRECEFDYFLIASDITYADTERVFAWQERGRALAAATQSDDPAKRRTLEKASEAWHAPGPETLAQAAERLGWVTATGVRSAASQRARAFVKHGMTYDTHARKQRQRQVKARRPTLDRVIEQILRQVPDEAELRYVVDGLRQYLAKTGHRGRRTSSKEQHDQWARDIRQFNGNAQALAKHWGIRRSMAYNRVQLIRRINWNQKKAS